MFRIRRIYDDHTPVNRKAMGRILQILHAQFPLLSDKELKKLPDQLRNPVKYRFRSVILAADDEKGNVKGFALLMHDPELKFCFLDFISTEPKKTGRGVGGALYDRVRKEAISLGAQGMLFECLPDDPNLCRSPLVLRENAARLRFYERYGARPVTGTAYETPLSPGGDNPPYLVYDNLGRREALRRSAARAMVQAILGRKYRELCSPEYVAMVVASFRDDPVRLRPPKYARRKTSVPVSRAVPPDKRIILVVSDQQAIHHIRERGYVESPVRIRSILKELDKTELFIRKSPRTFPLLHIRAVHDAEYLAYLRRVSSSCEQGESVYPYVFPIRNVARPPADLAVRAGYYCIDTFTPLTSNAWAAARRAVDCALTAASHILTGAHVSYALVRPPGHHAERGSFGGFCYLNSSAIAAHYLSRFGRVALLDIDYHHGNGQQDIFKKRRDVLTISIHGDPSFAYPYFSGFADERGEGSGIGFNWNIPLPEQVDGEAYKKALEKAVRRIRDHKPQFLVLALGLDTARNDPTGSWSLRTADFEENGGIIGALRLPTIVIQEGGYGNRVLGINARHFMQGLWNRSFA